MPAGNINLPGVNWTNCSRERHTIHGEQLGGYCGVLMKIMKEGSSQEVGGDGGCERLNIVGSSWLANQSVVKG